VAHYLLRRFLISIVTLLAISVVVFTVVVKAPGDPLAGLATNPNVSPERRAELRDKLGLNEPTHVRYYKWGWVYIQGDWGDSLVSKVGVREYVFGRIPVTLAIVGSAFLLGVLIAIPVGVISALKQYSLFDQFATTLSFIGFSVPTFFSGLLLIIVFSTKLNWLDFIYDNQKTGLWPNLKQSIMPITVLGLAGSAQLTRFVRASMLETINQDYVRTARAKGLREQIVVLAHVMRNALIPVVTIVMLQIPEIFGGAIVTEQIFRIPGIGRALVDAVLGGDAPVVMAIAFGVSILVVLFNVLADIMYGILDPRIKYS